MKYFKNLWFALCGISVINVKHVESIQYRDRLVPVGGVPTIVYCIIDKHSRFYHSTLDHKWSTVVFRSCHEAFVAANNEGVVSQIQGFVVDDMFYKGPVLLGLPFHS